MDAELAAVGDRIRSRLPLGMSQRRLAEKSGMTPDALSRALNGQRGFSSTELARIADQLNADVYWLITGKPDPQKVDVAARHRWDRDQRARTNPDRESDDAVLSQVIAAYRGAFPGGPPPSKPLAAAPELIRNQLGSGFVARFASAVEAELGVDVVRVSGLRTDYSLRIGQRAVVLLATMPSWFRSNWSLAHELGHLALGHHDGYSATDRRNERPADRFAADLLLPNSLVEQQDWSGMDEVGLTDFLWKNGVSTKALQNRLKSLKLKHSAAVAEGLKLSTAKLLRSYAKDSAVGHELEVTLREQQASTRLVPAVLVGALQHQVEGGSASPELLAWALDVPVDEIDFPEPSDEEALADVHALMLEDRPSAADLENWLASNGKQ